MSASLSSRWSFQMGALFGIPIRVHATFLLMVLWLMTWAAGTGQDVVLWMVVLGLAFASVIAHELGHAFAARGYDVETREIVLYPIGGLARLERSPSGVAEFVIALAGPAINLMLTFFFFSLVVAFEAPLRLQADATPVQVVLTSMLNANFLLFAVNLIPAFPMDGGRALRAFLSIAFTQEKATRFATGVTQFLALGFALLAVVGGFASPALRMIILFMAFVVMSGANRELLGQRTRTHVQSFTASDGMMTRVETVGPQQSLQWAARLLLATHQRDFPVVDAWGRVSGLLTRSMLINGLRQSGPASAILEVMDREVVEVKPDSSLEDVLDLLSNGGPVVVVVDSDRKFMGMITLEKIGQLIDVTNS